MHDDLVKRLRTTYEADVITNHGIMLEAADAIEELQQTVEHYKGCSDDWYKEACDYKAQLSKFRGRNTIEVVAAIKPGDTVYWVHCSNRVYKGTVQSIDVSEYQGALYCNIYSPSFRINPHPSVHYSFVFHRREEAQEFAEYQEVNQNHGIMPRCMGCHYNAYTEMKDSKSDPTNYTTQTESEAEWIWDDEGYHCSKCFHHAYGNTAEVLSGDYKYCPSCGAKMKAGEEDE